MKAGTDDEWGILGDGGHLAFWTKFQCRYYVFKNLLMAFVDATQAVSPPVEPHQNA